jgi:hypothetical protein
MSILVGLLVCILGLTPLGGLAQSLPTADPHRIFLPAVSRELTGAPTPTPPPSAGNQVYPRVFVPHFDQEVSFMQTAIFWFGQVNRRDNFVDARLGYTDTELYVRLAVFDLNLWFDPKPSAANLTAWDAADLYLSLDGNTGSALGPQTYRFQAALSEFKDPDHPEERFPYQRAQRGSPRGWLTEPLTHTTGIEWRGAAMNLNGSSYNDRGWTLTYHLPFASLGLDGPPAPGTVWGLALDVADRDDAAAAAYRRVHWPTRAQLDRPESWARLIFGLPEDAPPALSVRGQTVIRQGLNGAQVVDGEVGGGTLCALGLDFWSQWGDTPAPGSEADSTFNVQNQYDVADWPCYAKYYVTFPLDQIPAGQTVISATLTLYQSGNSGGGDWGEPPDSLIQVFAVERGFDEATLTWNNAPQALEGVARTWVTGLTKFPGWPGIPYTWSLGAAVQRAFAAGEPLHLALYSADGAYHSGKYFTTSDAAEWNKEARPKLTVWWGAP